MLGSCFTLLHAAIRIPFTISLAGCPSSLPATSAWQIAVPIVVGLLIGGLLVIIIVKLILFLKVRSIPHIDSYIHTSLQSPDPTLLQVNH